MAKTISSEFEGIWKRKTGKKAVTRIRYKRRYWSGSAFVFEADWQVINQDAIASVGDIAMSLDTQFLSVFKTSNVTIVLKNLHNEWLDIDTSPSVFAIDAVATVGYDSYKTKFNIQFGYTLSDGSNEWLSLFTGLAKTYKFSPKDAGVKITIVGNELLMQGADAKNVSDTFTEESTSPSQGDGSNADFLTTSEGVSNITQVRVAGVAQTQGTDYTVSQTDEYDTPAKITFTSGSIPPNGDAVDTSGIKWKDDETVDNLVGLLADEAGIGSGVRTISPVLFPGGLSGSKTVNSQAEWELGTLLTGIDTTTIPGSIRRAPEVIDEFDDADYSDDPVWTVRANAGGSASAASKYLRLSCSGIIKWIALDTPVDKDTGVYSFTVDIDAASSPGSSNSGDGGQVHFFLNANLAGFVGGVKATGYALKFNLNFDGGSNNQVQLMRYDAGGVMLGTVLANLGNFPSGKKTWTITRDGSNNMTVYLGTSEVGSVTDNTYTTNVAFGTSVQTSHSAASIGMRVDDIHYWEINQTVIYESEEFDLLAPPSAWGVLTITEILNNGTTVFKTNVSDTSGSGFDGWTALGAGNLIESNLKQYFKFQITITTNTTSPFDSPEIQVVIANFQTSTVFVSLANHSGKNVYNMIQRYAQIADYEMLFDGDGNFLFRSKTSAASPVVELTQGDGISSVSKYDLGFGEVINVGRVSYDEYIDEYDGADASESSPTSEERFGRIVRDENFGDILLANDSNLGTARARIIYENNFTPKKRIRMKTKIIPHLDLSDNVKISLYDNPLQRKSVWGDPMQKWGGPYHGWSDVLNILARDLNMKVVGIVYNINKLTCDLELKEN